jgi:hypothetical protein
MWRPRETPPAFTNTAMPEPAGSGPQQTELEIRLCWPIQPKLAIAVPASDTVHAPRHCSTPKPAYIETIPERNKEELGFDEAEVRFACHPCG